MDGLNVKAGTEIVKIVGEEIKKIHPRMYEVATIDFHNEVVNGDITMDIPYSVRNTIMKAIEDLGYSITFNYNDSVPVNAVKKQLQHDA